MVLPFSFSPSLHVLQYYPKFNNEHHSKPSTLYVCQVKISNLDNSVTSFVAISHHRGMFWIIELWDR